MKLIITSIVAWVLLLATFLSATPALVVNCILALASIIVVLALVSGGVILICDAVVTKIPGLVEEIRKHEKHAKLKESVVKANVTFNKPYRKWRGYIGSSLYFLAFMNAGWVFMGILVISHFFMSKYMIKAMASLEEQL